MSEISEFYTSKSILITGATGFLGKVLVEKILRSLPDVERVFLLIRHRNGADGCERLKKMLSSELFESVRKSMPHCFEKLTVINGNITEPNLGISDSDAKILIDQVSIVFHCAATVKFDEALKLSIEMNVSGTERLLHFCRKMPKIAVFVHASTAYANCNQSSILETVYKPPVDPHQLVEALSWMNEEMVASLTPHLIGQRPNTYTFTKALAEFIVDQEACHLPVAIVRPSIIGAIWKEPLPGWTDNLNGPTGLLAAIGKGLLRSMVGDNKAAADLIPVDIVANVLLVTAWYRAKQKENVCPIINCCTGHLNTVTWGDVVISMKFFDKYPLENIYRVPDPQFTMNRYWRDAMIFFDHILPAYLVDGCLRLVGCESKLIRIYRKLLRAVETLEYFTSRQWHFQSEMVVKLLNEMPNEEKQLFNIDIKQIDWNSYFEMYVLGVKKYILNEQLSNLVIARKQYQRKKNLTLLFNVVVKAILLRVMTKRYGPLFRRFWFYLIPIVLAWRQFLQPAKPKPVGLLKNRNPQQQRPLATQPQQQQNGKIEMMTSLMKKPSKPDLAMMSFSRLTDFFAGGES